MVLERASGILLHPTSFPNGVLDEHAFALSTGCRGRAALVAGSAARPARRDHVGRRTCRRRRSPARPRCSRARGRVFASRRRRIPRPAGLLDRRLGRVRGHRRGPGAVRPRMGRAPQPRSPSRRPDLRRHADLRRGRRRRPRGAPAALPAAASPVSRPTCSRGTASSGGIPSTTGPRCVRTVTAGGSSGSAAPSSTST